MKKKEEFYYKNLSACVDISYQAALYLRETLEAYDRPAMEKRLSAMRELEEKGDAEKHKMTAALNRAFITPVEREDLLALSCYLDDITDAVEKILLQIYICNVDYIRSDALPMAELLIDCIGALGEAVGELKDFRRSRRIADRIIRVNELEEQGDKLYVETMRRLYQEKDIRAILAWRNIYGSIENCMNICEHAADIMISVVMKNS